MDTPLTIVDVSFVHLCHKLFHKSVGIISAVAESMLPLVAAGAWICMSLGKMGSIIDQWAFVVHWLSQQFFRLYWGKCHWRDSALIPGYWMAKKLKIDHFNEKEEGDDARHRH